MGRRAFRKEVGLAVVANVLILTVGFLLGVIVWQTTDIILGMRWLGQERRKSDRRKSERRHPGVPEKVDPNDSN